jgi:molybdopterin-guanine dinucleotide biosynthesis protein A
VRVTAAILAGGLARRMNGVDKGSLSIGGMRIIERQIAALRQVADSILVVGGDASRFDALGVRAVGDVIAGAGALGGIYSALVASTDPRTLVVACDMPFLCVPLLRRLVQASPLSADVVMPRTHEGLQPLCAVYATRCAGVLRRRIERGLLKAAGVTDDVRVEEIGPDELATYDPYGLMFVNVNTPHDYERAKGLVDRLPESDAASRNPITDASGATPAASRSQTT